jgi:predicted nucleic acid-binding protein
LIALGRIDNLCLLGELASKLLIPEQVLAEVEAGFIKDRATAKTLAWATRYASASVPVAEFVAGWDLGAGESQVISLCLQNPQRQAVLDDGEARRCAAAVGVPMIGTLGVLLRAKRRGLIEAVRPLTDRLRRSGFHLDPSLVDRVLVRTGE